MTQAGRILFSHGPGERRAAVLDGAGRVVAVWHDRLGLAEAGSLHLGRVTGRLPDGSAVFVEIGGAVPGFLNAGDQPGGLPPEGAAVIVQVAAEARREKGARLTGKISLTDASLAYTPQRPGASVSSKLPPEERVRLKAMLADLLEPGEGGVVRTEATAAAMPASVAGHRAAWRAMQARAAQGKPPLRLSPPPDVLAEALVLCPDPQDILFDHLPSLTAAKRAHAALADRMDLERADLFALEGVDDAIEAALVPEVPLPCGGRLIVEPTAALVAVDVDAGPAAPAQANAEAVEELARQLDLRGLAGQIVCDFVPDSRDKGRRALLAALRSRLAAALAPTYVAGVSPLGLVELRRDRGRTPLADLLCDPSGRMSAASVALVALRRAVREGAATLEAAPEVVAALRGPLAAAVAEAEGRLHRPLTLKPRADYPRERVETVVS